MEEVIGPYLEESFVSVEHKAGGVSPWRIGCALYVGIVHPEWCEQPAYQGSSRGWLTSRILI